MLPTSLSQETQEVYKQRGSCTVQPLETCGQGVWGLRLKLSQNYNLTKVFHSLPFETCTTSEHAPDTVAAVLTSQGLQGTQCPCTRQTTAILVGPQGNTRQQL